LLGRLLSPRDAKATILNLGLSSGAARLTPEQQLERIHAGGVAVLANGWRIKRSTVSGDSRIEIVSARPFGIAETKQFIAQGAFVERIQWQERVFIPTGANELAVFSRITESKPVVDFAGSKAAEEGDADDSPMASVGTGARTRETPRSIRAAILARFGEGPIKALEDGGVLKIVADAADVPAGLLRRESDADAIYDPRNGVAYLISNRLTRDLAPAKVLHEIGEHYGLETMLGERGWRALAAKVRLMAKVDGSRAQGVWSAIRESYSEFAGLDDAALGQNKRFLHEVLAHLGETQAFRQNSVWRDLVTLLKRFLVKLGFTAGITEADVGALLEGSLKHAAREAGKGPPQPPRGGVSTKVSTAAAFASAEQTKTPAFKRWFGDWEAVSAATPVRRVSTLNEARGAAKQFVGRELRNTSTEINATVSGNTLEKMTSQSATAKSASPADHALAVANLDRLFASAQLDNSHQDEKGEPTIRAIHRFVSPMIALDGRVLAVKMTVKETVSDKQPNPLYTVEAIDVEKPALEAPRQSGIERDAVTGTSPQAGFAKSVERLLEAVKRWASTVVEAEGRPRVMYHATDAAGFSRFRSRVGDMGMHFGTKEQAEDRFDQKLSVDPYGPELRGVAHATMPVYLNIRNPLRLQDRGTWSVEDVLRDILLHPDLALSQQEIKALKVVQKPAELVRFLQSKGYDGIVYKNQYEVPGGAKLRRVRDDAWDEFEKARARDGGMIGDAHSTPEYRRWLSLDVAFNALVEKSSEDSYIAFDSNQIKSAVGNAGTFDPKSDDILRSQPAPVWYSELARQIDRAPMKRALAGAWMQYINALKGVKPDEIAWSGIEDFLKLQPGKVTKEQVSEFLRGDGVQVEETMLGGGGSDEILALTALIQALKVDAAPWRNVPATIEQWRKDFGPSLLVNTPVGEVKLGENQFTKLIAKERHNEIGLVKPTLEQPQFVINTPDGAKSFVKAFRAPNGQKFFASVSVAVDGLQVVISNHLRQDREIKRWLEDGRLLYTATAAPLPESPIRGKPEQPANVDGLDSSVDQPGSNGNDAPMASVPLNLPESLRSAPVRQSIRDRIADAFNTQRSFNWWHKSLGTQYHKAKIERHFAPVYELAQRYLDDTSRFANEAADRAPDLLPKTESVGDAFSGIANTARDAKDAQAIAGPIFEGTLRERVFSDAELRDPPLELGKPLFKPLTDRQIKLYRQYLSTVNHSLDTLAVSEMARLAKVSGLRVAPVDTGLDEAVSFYRDQYAGELEKVTLDIEELRKSQAGERKLLEEAAED